MPDVGFGTAGGYTRNTGDSPIYAGGISLPVGRACSDGANRAGITALGTYAGGYSGAGTVQLQLGSATSSAFGVSAGQALWTGMVGTGLWIVSGGSATFYIHVSQRTYFSGGGGGTTYDGDGFSWAGTPYGIYRYIMAPLAPSIVVTPDADGEGASIALTASGDNGGSAFTGHRIQRANNAAFTSGVVTTSAAVGANVITGLTPGAQYYWRAVSRNALTDAVGGLLGGQWSSTVVAEQPDETLGRIRNAGNSSWGELDGRIRDISNGSWLELDGRIRNADNTAWLPLGA